MRPNVVVLALSLPQVREVALEACERAGLDVIVLEPEPDAPPLSDMLDEFLARELERDERDGVGMFVLPPRSCAQHRAAPRPERLDRAFAARHAMRRGR